MAILLIDDDPHVTDDLVLYFEANQQSVEVYNEVPPREELLSRLVRLSPTAVVLDFDMPTPGDQVFTWIRSWSSEVPILFYTRYATSPNYRQLMLSAGAPDSHILLKSEAGSDALSILERLRLL